MRREIEVYVIRPPMKCSAGAFYCRTKLYKIPKKVVKDESSVVDGRHYPESSNAARPGSLLSPFDIRMRSQRRRVGPGRPCFRSCS